MIDGIFQVDHPLVEDAYQHDNYRIVLDPTQEEGTCALYFSSHNIYFPNDEVSFKARIVDRDFYELFKTRIAGVHKHIYLRDLHKQWYLTGISARYDSPVHLLELLTELTMGCRIVTAVGSSAGGYAACLYGSLLGAERVLSFNGQFEVDTQLRDTDAFENPLLFRFRDSVLRPYFDIKPFLTSQTSVYYFCSSGSAWDGEQREYVKECKAVRTISFNTAHHGIPFLKCALPRVINMSGAELEAMTLRRQSPLFFSMRLCGVFEVMAFMARLAWMVLQGKVEKAMKFGKGRTS